MIRRAFTAAVSGLALGACAHGTSYAPPIGQPDLVQVEVYDRTRGTTQRVHARHGRRYIVGTPGHEYAVRIRNTTGERVLVVVSCELVRHPLQPRATAATKPRA